jgi:hypothetical protein
MRVNSLILPLRNEVPYSVLEHPPLTETDLIVTYGMRIAGAALIITLKNALATRISNKALLSGKMGGDYAMQKEIELSEAIRIDNEVSNVFALAYDISFSHYMTTNCTFSLTIIHC